MLRLILASLLAGLVAVPAATAATPNQILRDCEDDGVLQGDYSNEELRTARRRIPTDLDQYTDCRDVLSRALSETVSGGPGRSGSLGGPSAPGRNSPLLTPATEEDRKALEEATAEGAKPVTVDNTEVVPGAVGFAANAARNDLPATLIVLLTLLALTAAAAMAPAARRRFGPLRRLGPLIRHRVLRRG